MGTTKDTRGDWRSGRWLIADSASVCQPEPEKRLDHASMSEHSCSFERKLYGASHGTRAQYHITNDHLSRHGVNENLAVATGLHLIEGGVVASPGHEFGVTACLDDAAAIQHQDLIGHPHG